MENLNLAAAVGHINTVVMLMMSDSFNNRSPEETDAISHNVQEEKLKDCDSAYSGVCIPSARRNDIRIS